VDRQCERERDREDGKRLALSACGNDEVGDAGIEPLDDENVDDEGSEVEHGTGRPPFLTPTLSRP